MRYGLGPVFIYEWLTASRRWQMYAGRAIFVLFLLAGLSVVWLSFATRSEGPLDLRTLARMGEGFFYAIIGTQLAIVLRAAPAATAGSICLDKARGSLIHLLVTDLSDVEIVLGKFAARLVPVVGLIAASLPVLAIGILLGGIEPEALVGAYLVTLAVGILGCALALTLSVWCSKTSEVLLTVFTLWTLTLLVRPVWAFASWAWNVPAPSWLWMLNPFVVALAPYATPGTTDLSEPLEFAGITFTLSVLLMVTAVLSVRRVSVRDAGRPARATRRFNIHLPGRLHALGRWMPRPSLDRNPVLWREWQRKQPSRWVRLSWTAYIILAGFFGIAAMVLDRGRALSGLANIVNALQVGVGLLLLSIGSVTSLAEERVRGSLDVLLATPLETRKIVWGKWWAAFRPVLFLAAWPTLVTAIACPESHLWGVMLMAGLVLAYGAAVTSLGLALATWVAALGRAVALGVTAYVFISVGFPVVVQMIARNNWGLFLACASPFLGVVTLTQEMEGVHAVDTVPFLVCNVCWMVAYAVVAAGLLWLTLLTFDRRLGRVSDRNQPSAWRGIRAAPRLATALGTGLPIPPQPLISRPSDTPIAESRSPKAVA
jgi:ABC-type transport system involved in multi-copper enzyme maturation permease subunit